MKIEQGDVKITSIKEVRPTTDDFLMWRFQFENTMFTPVSIMLAGDKNIQIKIWKDNSCSGKPTVIHTELKWQTFSMDDNIEILTKKSQWGYAVLLVTKKYDIGRTLL